MLNILREGGPLAFLPLFLFVLPGLPMLVAQFVIGHRVRMVSGAWVAAMLPALAGVTGYFRHGTQARAALGLDAPGGAALDPRVVDALVAQSHHESVVIAASGLVCSAVLAVLVLAASAANATRRPRVGAGALSAPGDGRGP